ncbi:transcriptional regulator [Geminocystis sp. NIES-3708]|uniref:AbrB/MazE/SpoVT family DNA-binding domain-containing protein n=1 Tax=Geminocystis sp. NIES-3708 TaxID=1615909 RepID=UPI0005FC62B3|nr:AbrB/MazE/SpoVT family DNA-binding domain-containing protein [Geminocystis sp. NIES-3708]BAQ60024.1 transcriptional regulator [Geminocystis sp. NIES-3708]
MLEVTLSKEYQIVIPQEIRKSLHLKAGQKFSLVIKDDLISLIPRTNSLESFRGILKGANIDNIRDIDKRVQK